ncbi:hypothetical protein BDR06DRAFT_969455 [Suillus hirtellus]|nr:hypothetical protein BDR06DRAFT_969455 [Suillus hirtellus]
MTPKAANNALNITLAMLQSLIKHCIQLKQGDQEALKLSYELARCVLLSYAAIVQQYSKGGAFQTVPNWNSVVDNDPHIKSHPHFYKTLDYHPLAAVGNILQAIWNLGSKFDLLATNERVDALDAKVNSVEEVFGHQMATLE